MYVDMQDADADASSKVKTERQTHETGCWDDFFFTVFQSGNPTRTTLKGRSALIVHFFFLSQQTESSNIDGDGINRTCIRGFGNAMQFICKQQDPWDGIRRDTA